MLLQYLTRLTLKVYANTSSKSKGRNNLREYGSIVKKPMFEIHFYISLTPQVIVTTHLSVTKHKK